MLMFPMKIVLRFVDEEKNGADARELAADEAANVEHEGVTVGVVEGGGQHVGAWTQFTAHF